MRALRAAALLALACCGPREASRRVPPPPRGAVIARVDGVEITEDLVRVTAARERVDARTALGMLVDEAVLAKEARRRGVGGPGAEEDARWHAMVRRVIELEVDAPYAPSRLPPDMLDAFIAQHRAQRCHDGLRRVVHVVFRAADNLGPTARDALRARAEAFRAALAARFNERPTAAQLQAEAEALHDAMVSFEALPGIDRHAGMATGGGVVPEFARAIWALDGAHPLSASFATSYGYHVALLVEEVPPMTVPCEALRPQFAVELSELRRNGAIRALLGRLRARAEVHVDRTVLRAADARPPR